MPQVAPTMYVWRVSCPLRAVAVALVACFCLTAADWPRFRGPNGAGSSGAKGLPVEFGRHKNVAWKRSVPAGKSSPVIVGERIFLTAHEDDKRIVLCLDRESGAELWRRHVIAERTEPRHPLNDPASPTPVSDDANVYAFFSEFGLAAYGPNGELLWRVPLGPFEISQGMGASPILADGKVILIADQAKSSYLAAFDTANGKMVWKAERRSIENYEAESGLGLGGHAALRADGPGPLGPPTDTGLFVTAALSQFFEDTFLVHLLL